MTPDYLTRVIDWTQPGVVAVFDEAPLWSALFGQLLLDHVPLIPNARVLDLACGAGFPLLDLAQRIGPTCRAYGLDPWQAGLDRAVQKKVTWDVRQVRFVLGDGAAMPFADGAFDLITSNLGINNFADAPVVLAECARVLAPGGRLALTTNLRGHMHEFYTAYADTLRDLGRADLHERLEAHIAHRFSLDDACRLLERLGFRVAQVHEQSFTLRYLDGSALLNHRFIQLAFLEGWREWLPPEEVEAVFRHLEQRLNALAQRAGGLTLTVPAAYIEVAKR